MGYLEETQLLTTPHAQKPGLLIYKVLDLRES